MIDISKFDELSDERLIENLEKFTREFQVYSQMLLENSNEGTLEKAADNVSFFASAIAKTKALLKSRSTVSSLNLGEVTNQLFLF